MWAEQSRPTGSSSIALYARLVMSEGVMRWVGGDLIPNKSLLGVCQCVWVYVWCQQAIVASMLLLLAIRSRRWLAKSTWVWERTRFMTVLGIQPWNREYKNTSRTLITHTDHTSHHTLAIINLNIQTSGNVQKHLYIPRLDFISTSWALLRNKEPFNEETEPFLGSF